VVRTRAGGRVGVNPVFPLTSCAKAPRLSFPVNGGQPVTHRAGWLQGGRPGLYMSTQCSVGLEPSRHTSMAGHGRGDGECDLLSHGGGGKAPPTRHRIGVWC
jgi:hypothetical protein